MSPRSLRRSDRQPPRDASRKRQMHFIASRDRERPRPSQRPASSRRARDTRAFMVPTGTAQIAAASAWDSPWAPDQDHRLPQQRRQAAQRPGQVAHPARRLPASAGAFAPGRASRQRAARAGGTAAAHGRCCAPPPGTRRAGRPPRPCRRGPRRVRSDAPPAPDRRLRCGIRRDIGRRPAVPATIARALCAARDPWLVRSRHAQYQPAMDRGEDVRCSA